MGILHSLARDGASVVALTVLIALTSSARLASAQPAGTAPGVPRCGLAPGPVPPPTVPVDHNVPPGPATPAVLPANLEPPPAAAAPAAAPSAPPPESAPQKSGTQMDIYGFAMTDSGYNFGRIDPDCSTS